MIKKVPWGILSGIFFTLCSFLTVAFIAVTIVSNVMISEVGSDDGLSTSWWFILITIVDIVSFLGFLISIGLYIKKEQILDEEEVF